MKRIAYLLSYDLSRNDGVVKKIRSQTEEWQKHGVEVRVFCMTHSISPVEFEVNQYLIDGAIFGRVRKQRELINDLEDFSPDVIYHRYEFWNATTIYLGKAFKVIAELNTDDLSEYKLKLKQEKTLKSLLRYFIVKLCRVNYLRSFKGGVGVTKEISELESYTKYCSKQVFIPNSIDLDRFKIIKKVNEEIPSRIGLFFIGSPNQSWHGIDIIQEWAEKLPQYDFHIVGSVAENSNNVFYHGYLKAEEYVKVLKKCHVCIGSLALFRNNLSEACPLKVREYIAYGYPTIIGYSDTAFIDQEKPNWLYEYNVGSNIRDLELFIEKNASFVIDKPSMTNISSDHVEEKRLNFMLRLIDEKN